CFFASLLAIVIATPADAISSRFWTHPVMRFLGKYSYGIYVFHEVLRPLYLKLFPYEALQHLLHSHGLANIAFIALETTCSIAVAFASFHLYETPFLSLKRFFEYRRDKSFVRGELQPVLQPAT
ncbi:MAG: hypothetical protein JO353_09925, partial [Phycisphaerae bacterium]|nr:hypothetical protein [Phycisphaerae bacterium]